MPARWPSPPAPRASTWTGWQTSLSEVRVRVPVRVYVPAPGEPRDVVDLIEYRVGVESEIAAHAATRRSETQLLAIQRALDAFASVGGEPEKAVRADFAFHLAIAQATNNRLFLGALEELGPRMILLQRTGLDENSALTSASHLATVLAEHAQVVAAIQRSDPLAAAAAMRLHLSNSKSRLRP